ncbi:hypothetical protein K2173_004568 [Erythroxylum novogranatense]|uniref:Uncharacterized protein n=1 Tax=Erythroxylum novogranatense TaxID=1862640 RepID=A0AAV8T5C3_9ROSI|nr:hypothetical protein K2173_004568 [Erythroxylum novogranatense]
MVSEPSLVNAEKAMCGLNVVSIRREEECDDIAFSSELDHIPLIQRRKLLLARNRITPAFHYDVVNNEDGSFNSQGPSAQIICEAIDQHLLHQQNQENKNSLSDAGKDECDRGLYPVHSDQFSENATGQDLDISTICISQGSKVYTTSDQRSLDERPSGSVDTHQQAAKLNSSLTNVFANELDHITLKKRLRILLRRKMLKATQLQLEGKPMGWNLNYGRDYLPPNPKNLPCSKQMNSVKVKTELLEDNELQNLVSNEIVQLSNILPMKVEVNELYNDNKDHMQLGDRIRIQTDGDFKSDVLGRFQCLRKRVPLNVECDQGSSEVPNPMKSSRPRKRNKTATDSVETALEEDAPGLLQALLGQGVNVHEIKLYGETENDEAIDESFIEDSFAEFEAVMSKLFLQRNSFLKLAPIRFTKASKPTYCLECLFSLVEQTRYLQFRNWPAQWGWCRDLQSFIFVFKRHNRIVLERPEYGYATYFFELVDSLSINWQIKRLMTVMKLTNCGRISLIENKALLIGHDLSEGEAQVLTRYGWIPNGGIATMLNYCDRVVHDRKSEKDRSEWRLKIGKLLMNGYNGGIIASTNLPL